MSQLGESMRCALSVVFLLDLLSSPAFASEAGSRVPEDAIAFVSARDVRPWLRAAARSLRKTRPGAEVTELVTGWERSLAGEVTLLALPSETEEEEPEYMWRISLETSATGVDSLVRGVAKYLPGLGKAEFHPGSVRQLDAPLGYDDLFWTVRDDVLYAGTARTRVETAGAGEGTLVGKDFYRQLGKHVDWDGDLVAFVDLKALIWDTLGADLIVSWLKPHQLPAAGFSWSGGEGRASARLAVLADEPRAGLAAFFDLPNARPRHLEHVPAGCHFVQWTTATAKGLVARTATLMGDLDPDIAREFREELAEFNEELGVDLGKDLLDNAGDSVTGVDLGDLSEPTLYHVLTVRDEERFQGAAAALARFNETPLKKHSDQGRDLHVLPLALPVYYTFDGGRLFASSAAGEVEGMVRPSAESRSLAAVPVFGELRNRLPSECLLLWAVDRRRLVELIPVLIQMSPEAASDIPLDALQHVLEGFRAGEPGPSFGLALRNEPDALVLSVESVGVDPWALLPRVLEGLLADNP